MCICSRMRSRNSRIVFQIKIAVFRRELWPFVLPVNVDRRIRSSGIAVIIWAIRSSASTDAAGPYESGPWVPGQFRIGACNDTPKTAIVGYDEEEKSKESYCQGLEGRRLVTTAPEFWVFKELVELLFRSRFFHFYVTKYIINVNRTHRCRIL